jgi:hypothetical protein
MFSMGASIEEFFQAPIIRELGLATCVAIGQFYFILN